MFVMCEVTLSHVYHVRFHSFISEIFLSVEAVSLSKNIVEFGGIFRLNFLLFHDVSIGLIEF